ncbi:DNA polymerase III subunit delta [Candidatus Parcubacteria bacterium]|jgi:DNA polymerase-3 subunit delta|nr:DNA polymerase III subunit delta [Candidatus Parcubacteria bacterium]MBT7228816.1 DNA polymerase III subunit delta [Candidatus Parcubacteria bacterium]
MIFFYYGEDSFRAHQKIKAIKKKFKDKIDPSEQNVQLLDGETLKADDFFRTVSVVGFLADKKLVVIKNIFDNKKLSTWQDTLIDYLKKQKDDKDENYLIFWQVGKPRATAKLYKALLKFKFVEEFKNPGPNELVKWIRQQIENKQKEITDSAINTLIAFVGNDLWQLNNEISKLLNYNQTTIDEEHVKELVQAKVDDNIFSFIDAIGNKDKAVALNMLEEKLDMGVNVQYILSMIIRQFRMLIKTKAIEKQTTHPGVLTQTLKIPPLAAKKTLAQSKLYTAEDLKKIYAQLLFLDEKFKTTQNQEKILFAQMINSL